MTCDDHSKQPRASFLGALILAAVPAYLLAFVALLAGFGFLWSLAVLCLSGGALTLLISVAQVLNRRDSREELALA
ncbi:hypothetical protein GCM10011360_37990 [Primorskyibacter flagellatus]|uniref:Uncharacterized protein n=1 Tax=Primorskyibacter flagellatus TaxID=1387277 RepID=A0A917AEW1_9RHOB|nr:hypothetical protein [Primorskyibacter flagellatus]GGE47149.1 hypothetical protein GCM10011360_37990 [Primorskyibacter flagellatus]